MQLSQKHEAQLHSMQGRQPQPKPKSSSAVKRLIAGC